ncbi:type II secretion system protein [Planctomycetota bacterium]
MSRLLRLSSCGTAGQRGLALLEVIAVVAALSILLAMGGPIDKAREKAQKVACMNNLRQIAMASQMYADDDRKNLFPWSKPIKGGPTGTLLNDDDARACLELIYKYDYIDDPAIFVCKASKDVRAKHIDDLRERLDGFHLYELNCSYTYRSKVTTVMSSSKSPLSGDKRGGKGEKRGVGYLTNHKDGRNVVYKNGNVTFYTNEALLLATDRDAKRCRAELVGFPELSR